MPLTDTTWAPTFGETLGEIVSLLHLDDEHVGGLDAGDLARSDESARKFYRGQAIPWKEERVLRAFAGALLHSRSARPLSDWAEAISSLAPGYGVPLRTPHEALQALIENLRALYEMYPCELSLLVSAADGTGLTLYALLRMLVPDLAVRIGAMAGMGWVRQPDTWGLDWARKDGQSPLARELDNLNMSIEDLVTELSKEKSPDPLSRTAIYDRLTRRPCDDRVLRVIAGQLARRAGADADAIERRLRFEYMLWVMGGKLAEMFGWDPVTDLAYVLREVAQAMANTSSPLNPQWSSEARRRWSICMTVLEGTTWQPTREALRKMPSPIPAWRDDYLAIADGRTVDRLGAWQRWFASLPRRINESTDAVERVVRWMNLIGAPEAMDQQPISPLEPSGLRSIVRAFAHEGRSEFAAAARCYRDAIACDSDNPSLWQHMALNLSAAGDGVEALNAMSRAWELDPANAPLACEYADMLTDSGRPQEALTILSRITDEAIRDWYYFFFQRGRALYHLGQHHDALADFVRTVERRPGLGEAYAYAAVCAGHSRDTKKTKSLAAHARNLGANALLEALRKADRRS